MSTYTDQRSRYLCVPGGSVRLPKCRCLVDDISDDDIEFYGVDAAGIWWASWPACPAHPSNRHVSPVYHPEIGELRQEETAVVQTAVEIED